ncbi:uncharacterized protein Z519_04654 [Cladophialophora bantiana CBS 173.52]|uniref:Uncharacterized protein n=1 Tax=Cladophialophora bantiana (strain ATCC 10958 / CBS 173.52 / CDC B-1940 / NIH 8579) TaxID=1442370 RepID=A0A0D2G7R1_CLAB1|nr:uncharacterized protein Z519_04654 [Cladophialophora bantiana CBS 173.52]KIW94677.1 hypothetical protein Z519_04654 [Cladophialophora bantiana CBS 173.52]
MSSPVDAIEKEPMSRLDRFASAGQGRCSLRDYLHYFTFDVLGEVAFYHRYGFVGTGTNVEGRIKYIDDVQFYDDLVGHIPWLHYLLRLNPLAPYIPGLSLKPVLLTRMALEELQNGRKLYNKRKSSTEREDLLAQFIQGPLRAPEKFT